MTSNLVISQLWLTQVQLTTSLFHFLGQFEQNSIPPLATLIQQSQVTDRDVLHSLIVDIKEKRDTL